MRARDVLLEVLHTEGVRHIFGNPGSTELPLIDALAGTDDLHYVLALQEASAVAMAEGYAQATGRPAFLNLHTSAGSGTRSARSPTRRRIRRRLSLRPGSRITGTSSPTRCSPVTSPVSPHRCRNGATRFGPPVSSARS